MQGKQNCNQKKARVFSYARWSSDQQTDGDSLRRQTQLAQNWCDQHGLRLTDSARDEGISAWNGGNRAAGSGLSKLLQRIQPGAIIAQFFVRCHPDLSLRTGPRGGVWICSIAAPFTSSR
jgi:predicted site-specific integrase-resolvase